MRHGRAKASRRTLQFYKLNAPHVVRSPYRILLDGTFLVSSIRNKVPLHERLTKLLQNEKFECRVTRSTLEELGMLSESFGKSARGGGGGVGDGVDDREDDAGAAGGAADDGRTDVFARARRYGLDECVIIEDAGGDYDDVADEKGDMKIAMKRNAPSSTSITIEGLSSEASKDIYKLATVGMNNSNSYFVATQDDSLSDALRAVPYVPILRLGRAVLLLESPSAASRQHAGTSERNKLRNAGGTMTSEERDMLHSVKRRDALQRGEDARAERKELEMRSRGEIGGSYSNRKRKRAKGPNPLSCKSGKK